MVAPAVAAVEREAGGPEPGLLAGGRRGEELPDGVPHGAWGSSRRAALWSTSSSASETRSAPRSAKSPGRRRASRGARGGPGGSNVVKEGRLPGAGAPPPPHQPPEGHPHVERPEVAQPAAPRSSMAGPVGRHGPAGAGRRDKEPAREACKGSAMLEGLRALPATVPGTATWPPRGARLGPDLDHVVRAPDHRLVVLDHDHGVAGGAQRADDPDHAARRPSGGARRSARRHPLRHGRAERRAPPEGRRAAGDDHPHAGRRRQHRDRGRARRGDDPGRGPRDRDRARAGRARRPRRLPGHGRGDAAGPLEHHGGVLLGQAQYPGARRPQARGGRRPGHRAPGRHEAQPPVARREDPPRGGSCA